jgi:hypothetical protein
MRNISREEYLATLRRWPLSTCASTLTRLFLANIQLGVVLQAACYFIAYFYHVLAMGAVHLLQFDLILHFFVEVCHIVQLVLMFHISFVCLIIYKCRRSSGFSRGVSKYRGVARSSITSIHLFDLQGMFGIDFQHLSNYCNLAMLSLKHSILRWMLNKRQFQVSSSKFALQ